MMEFSSQARLELIAEVHRLAVAERKKLEDVLDEALIDWVERQGGDARRPEVSAHRRASVARRRKLYEELAHCGESHGSRATRLSSRLEGPSRPGRAGRSSLTTN